jgi:WD40 repeat protein
MSIQLIAVLIAGLVSLSLWCHAAEPQAIVELARLPTRCLCFSPDGGKLAVGGSVDNRAAIQVIDTGNWRTSTSLTLRGNTVMAVAFSMDSSLLFVAVNSSVVAVRLADVKEMARLSRHTDLVFAIAVSSDGRYVATSGQDGRVCLWDAKELTHIKDLDRHADSIFALTFDRRSSQLAAVGRNIFRIWPGLEKGRLEDVPINDSALSVCFSPQGDKVVAATISGNLIVAKCDQPTKDPQVFRLGSYLGDAEFIKSSDVMVVGINRDLALVDLNEGKITKRVDRVESRIGGIDYDATNTMVAVGTWDGTVHVWNANDFVDDDKPDRDTSVPNRSVRPN